MSQFLCLDELDRLAHSRASASVDCRIPPAANISSRWPCKDLHNKYSGCVGMAVCAELGTERCWDGRLLTGRRTTPQKIVWLDHRQPRTSSECKTCCHAVDVTIDTATAVVCNRGHWYAATGLAGLAHDRVPLREDSPPPCQEYERAETLRPEVDALLSRDRDRKRTRRELLRESASKRAGQTWGEVL